MRHAVRTLGLRGLYYANRGLFTTSYAHAFDDDLFDPFWAEVQSLGIPVFWELVGVPDPTDPALMLQEIERLNGWLERWPTIPSVWTHGFDPQLLADMPDALARLLRHEQVSVEILYPIHWARQHEYPFPELRPALATLYQRCGGARLIWGSDMPNVERNCTYRQSLQYLRRLADGLVPPGDLERVLGLNVLRVLGVGADARLRRRLYAPRSFHASTSSTSIRERRPAPDTVRRRERSVLSRFIQMIASCFRSAKASARTLAKLFLHARSSDRSAVHDQSPEDGRRRAVPPVRRPGGKWVIVANHEHGSVAVFPVDADGQPTAH